VVKIFTMTSFECRRCVNKDLVEKQ